MSLTIATLPPAAREALEAALAHKQSEATETAESIRQTTDRLVRLHDHADLIDRQVEEITDTLR